MGGAPFWDLLLGEVTPSVEDLRQVFQTGPSFPCGEAELIVSNAR